jgi:hypothetical protein
VTSQATGGTCGTYGEKEDCTEVCCVEKPVGKRPLARARRRLDGNNQAELKEIRREGVDWVGFVWLRIETSIGSL